MKEKFLIKLSLLYLILGLCISCENEELHENSNQSHIAYNYSKVCDKVESFWYNGEKVYLTTDSTKLYVVYKDNDITDGKVINGKVINEGLLIPTIGGSTMTRTQDNNVPKWQIIEESNLLKTRSHDDESISYISPFYISNKSGKSVGVSNLIHVKLKDKDDYTVLEEQMKKYNLSVFSQNQYMPLWYTIACQDDMSGNALEICNILHETHLFDIVEPDLLLDLEVNAVSVQIPNDTYYNKQWNLHGNNSINWLEAHSITKGDNVKIALIDTGVDPTHPEFDMSRVNQAYDANASLWYGNTIYGSHGISCAGIMVARTNNNMGIAGIAPNANLDSYADPLTKRPNASQTLASELYLAINSSDVVSCSWGGADLMSSEITQAITWYLSEGRNNKGTVIVFSSGNNNSSVIYPANCTPEILVVGASDQNGRRCNFSNYGSELDIVAPGTGIYTLGYNSQGNLSYTADFNGTSAACPHVAAVAALVLSVNPNLTNLEVNDIIEKTAKKVGNYTYTTKSDRKNGTWNQYMGYGLLDATAAVKAAQATLK